MFYSIAISSMLESSVAVFVENLRPLFGDNEQLYAWLEDHWLPEEREHGRITQQWLQRVWPEFRWQAAYDLFYRHYEPRCRSEHLRPTPALEALSRCVTEAQATMIYRCLESYAQSPDVKQMLRRMSQDEVRHYTRFRDIFDEYNLIHRHGFLRRAYLVWQRTRLVRDEDSLLAFEAINAVWPETMPFAPMQYAQYLARSSEVMAEHFPVEAARRMLFRPLQGKGYLNRLSISLSALLVRRIYRIRV